MSHTLYQFPGNPRGQVCRIVADMAGIPLNYVWTDFAGTKAPEYLAKHALGRIPILETPQGTLFETNSILRYLARNSSKRTNLLGKTPFEEGLVNQWLDIVSLDMYPIFRGLFQLSFGWGENNQENLEKYADSKKKAITQLQVLNNHLMLNTFVAGHQVTVADVNLYTVLVFMFTLVFDENQRKQFPNVVRYYIHLGHCDEIAKYYRQPYLTKTEWVQAPKKAENKEGKEGEGKQKGAAKGGDKKEAPKKNEQKKAEQPKKAAKKEEDDDDEEREKPKAKDPLDLLPPSTFNLFDFKTLFVNAPNKQEAIDFLWKNYDAAGFSFWYVKYQRYEGEGIKLHLTSNLKDSTMQRLDTFRKYVFGTFGVYGDEGNYEIRGVWLWRGTEIPNHLKENLPNFEYHDWIKLDHTNAEHRKLLEEYWTGLTPDVSVADGLVARDTGYVK